MRLKLTASCTKSQCECIRTCNLKAVGLFCTILTNGTVKVAVLKCAGVKEATGIVTEISLGQVRKPQRRRIMEGTGRTMGLATINILNSHPKPECWSCAG